MKANVVICGAGIAGISTAYYLAVHHGVHDVFLIDERAPLTLTSDKSTEAYRNWWPGPGTAMVDLMNRSIDLLDELALETGNSFHMNRRGYIYLTADPGRVAVMKQEAVDISRIGAGPLRIEQSYSFDGEEGQFNSVSGADLILNPDVIAEQYPFINPQAKALLHTRRCGWLSAQQLGMVLLERARDAGVRLINGRVNAIKLINNTVNAVDVQAEHEVLHIQTRKFVNAAGPYVKDVGKLLGLDLPVYNEAHGKVAFEDPLGIIPRNCPMMIWDDPIFLPWSIEEREDLSAFEDTRWLLDEFPAGLHFRPEGGPGSQTVLALWPYHIETYENPVWPLQFDPEFVEIVMRGMVYMVPGLEVYLGRMSRPYIDGGYYTKTKENRFLSCPLPVSGAYIFGALSGYGIMAALAGAELLTAHMTGGDLPQYAGAFDLDRYDDPAYQKLLQDWEPTAGQL
ncbi:MAG: FAD-binding oxidoreductase [Candidatus Promineifilaceae bacterium]|nr:FAD-binding oxidoreductase [Candidatus Promineifilaceae bacterium]